MFCKYSTCFLIFYNRLYKIDKFIIYIDDIIIAIENNKNNENNENLRILRDVLYKLKHHNLELNLCKYQFLKCKIEYSV